MTKISKNQAGTVGEVKWITNLDDRTRSYLKDRGLEEGAIIQVIASQVHHMIIGINDRRLVIDRSAADHICVDPIIFA